MTEIRRGICEKQEKSRRHSGRLLSGLRSIL
jgi:hypothetical protein